MPIAIECQDCHRSYKVDDKLAGKTVKCKDCAALIPVPGGEAPVENQCVSCGRAVPPGNRVCPHCGFNLQTGQKELLLLADDTDAARARKNKRWIRKSGSPLLEMLDRLIKIVAILTLLAGLAMTLLHIFTSPAGISFQALLPILVVLLAVIVIVVPLTTLAVTQTVKALKLPPRDDTYMRLLSCMLLPLTFSMIAGWPEYEDSAGWVAGLGWPLAILLLLFLLRGDLFEWIGSVVAAIATAALSLIVVSLLGIAVNLLAGGLYGDMLPKGPWTALAKGHSPLPPPVEPKTQPAIASTVPAPATTGAPLVSATATAPVTTQEAPPTTIVAVTRPGPTTGPSTTAAAPPAAAPRTTSAFFASVIDIPDIAGSAAVVSPLAPGDWMLTLKNTDTSTEIDRWTLNPLEKKDHHSYPYFAKKPAQFALSPHGDAIAVLSFLPRRQLDVVALDGKTPARNILFDLPANVPNAAMQAAPVLLGVLDPAHYYVRWDIGSTSALQVFAATAPTAGTPPWIWAGLDPSSESSPPAISPSAHLVAVVGKNQLNFATTDRTTPPRPILLSSAANFRVLGVTFSPDSSNIAVFAAVADLPTVMAFQIKTGTPVFTGLLSQTPVEKESVTMPHVLVWLGGAQICLINGNDLVNAETGKKFGSLGLTGVTDVQVLGPSMVALTFKNADGSPHTILARLDDEKLRAARNQ